MGQQVVVQESKTAKCMPIIRIVNIITGFVLIGFGIAGIIYMAITNLLSGKFFLVFSPIFMVYFYHLLSLFGCMIIAAECKIMFIIKQFGFLQTLIGRGVFNIYLASSVFYYFACGSGDNIAGWILAIILFLMGILYFVLQCCGGSEYNKEIKEQMM